MKLKSFASLHVITILCGTAAVAVGCSGDPYELPDFEGPVTTAAVPPPAISGGTLALSSDGRTLVAADPDRDAVWIGDVTSRSLLARVSLEAGDEPGRVVIDEASRAHVILRGGGAVVTIDLTTASVIARRPVCATPRGLAIQPEFGEDGVAVLHVACAAGKLITLGLEGDAVLRTVKLDRDLRDVVVTEEGRLLITRFRASELLEIDDAGEVAHVGRPATLSGQTDGVGEVTRFEPAVAWRTVALPGGGAVMLHQRSKASTVEIVDDAYTQGVCAPTVVHGTATLFQPDGGHLNKTDSLGYIPEAMVAVDIAVRGDGEVFAAVSAGNDRVMRWQRSAYDSTALCGLGAAASGGYNSKTVSSEPVPGQPIAVAFTPSGQIVVQLREPAGFVVLPPTVSTSTTTSISPVLFGAESRRDTGHDMFHRNDGALGALACATCHAEGRDDGRVWSFAPDGPRRTQSLVGGLLETAPFHWDGSLRSLEELIPDTLVTRMGGENPGPRHIVALGNWLDTLPLVPREPAEDLEAVSRGEALFGAWNCATCHSGSRLTNNASYDVGRGFVQVPSLRGIIDRAPYMHDGCAKTLQDRFDPACGGDSHNVPANVTQAEIDDIVAYLGTL